MTTLIACLSTGKGTWSQVLKVMNSHEWEKVILITNDFGKEKFSAPDNVEMVVIDEEKTTKDLIEDIGKGLSGLSMGHEVAINITSGTGKEHMALICAVLKIGVGLRFVDTGDNGIEEL